MYVGTLSGVQPLLTSVFCMSCPSPAAEKIGRQASPPCLFVIALATSAMGLSATLDLGAINAEFA